MGQLDGHFITGEKYFLREKKLFIENNCMCFEVAWFLQDKKNQEKVALSQVCITSEILGKL